MEGTCKAKVTVGQVTVELEGGEQFVRDELESFRQSWLSKPPSDAGVVPTPIQGPSKGSKLNIRDFTAGRNPKTDMERAAIVAYYLGAHGGVEEIDGPLLNQWFVKAGWKPSPKPGNTLDNAMRMRGYFDKGTGAGKFRLSDAGTYYVEHDSGGTPEPASKASPTA